MSRKKNISTDWKLTNAFINSQNTMRFNFDRSKQKKMYDRDKIKAFEVD